MFVCLFVCVCLFVFVLVFVFVCLCLCLCVCVCGVFSWVSRDVINFTGGQLQIDTQSLDGNNFSLYVLTFCLAANMCNFVRFVHSSTV